jgi:Ohr subfamily peroxiredoxin
MHMSDELIYTAKVKTTGGRDGGEAISDDGNLEVALSMPKEFGGPGGNGTNPEQLFAAAYSGCFLSATKLVARLEKIKLPEDPTIEAHIGVLSTSEGYKLTAELLISIPQVERDIAENIVVRAHQRCPFSIATRGNMDVKLTLV